MIKFKDYLDEYEEFIEACCDSILHHLWGCNLNKMVKGARTENSLEIESSILDVSLCISIASMSSIDEYGAKFEKFRHLDKEALEKSCKIRLSRILSEQNPSISINDDNFFIVKAGSSTYLTEIRDRIKKSGSKNSIYG